IWILTRCFCWPNRNLRLRRDLFCDPAFGKSYFASGSFDNRWSAEKRASKFSERGSRAVRNEASSARFFSGGGPYQRNCAAKNSLPIPPCSAGKPGMGRPLSQVSRRRSTEAQKVASLMI